MSDKIWKVEVSDEYLTFKQVDKPLDFDKKRIEHKNEEFGGTYCGNRGFYDTQFSLVRNLKWRDEYYHSGKYESIGPWRRANGYAYAWEPSVFYDYDGKLYTTHINFR
jgi:hypothetical protein